MSGYVPQSGERDLAKLVMAIRQLYEGRSNAVGSFTITPSMTSTVVTARNCSPTSFILLMPKTANAAAHKATTSIVPGTGQFTVSHASNSNADCHFGYAIVG